jgi:hypothetical protein
VLGIRNGFVVRLPILKSALALHQQLPPLIFKGTSQILKNNKRSLMPAIGLWVNSVTLQLNNSV